MKLTPINLLLFQILAHVSTIYYVFTYLTFSTFFIVFGMYFLTGCIGMSVTYHRLLTHRSFQCNKWFEYIGTLCATIGLTGSSLSWTAAHRKHHSRADKEGDPHSPIILGYFKAQWLSMFSNINVAKSPVIGDKFHRFLHRHYLNINIAYGLSLYLIGGLWATLTFWLVPACILWNAGSLINTVCHTPWLGYRNYKVQDNSINNPILGILMWGEGWHNNHHRFQNKPNIGEHWWEIDFGYYIIKLIRTA
jgi:fatty-acid desaturase